MPERTATVASTSGLHARPANLFVQAVRATGLPVTVGLPGQPPVDARSILSVMALAAPQGAEVVLAAEGDGADEALDRLVRLVETNLDEDEPDVS